ncbi:MAG: GNAT family N-acetyltransferase [Chlorobiaceae bacterium]|nr:GNAT family N-acetyltransferase [Chlorobiaceae bacterium]NTW10378.1 GNAT family N-acetyltransferase [Chlorobiaceae bacterium]
MSSITVSRIESKADRAAALEIIHQVFCVEKNWIHSTQDQIPEEFSSSGNCSWFIAKLNGLPAGLLRLQYDPSLDIPEEYGVKLMPGVSIESMKGSGKYVEIGRFMILEKFRRNHRISLRLMRAATAEVIERDYTHFITDVFEGEKHSPLNFHTRVLGFEVIGKHLFGELNCSSTRIILTLDILKLYSRVKDSKSRIYQELTEGMKGIFERKGRLQKTLIS